MAGGGGGDGGSKIRTHGVDGVWYGGEWLDIEECDGKFTNVERLASCSTCDYAEQCPRSRSRTYAAKAGSTYRKEIYDIAIIGAGCVGSAVARELSKYQTTSGPLSIVVLEASDDVSQGATKGNSGIVHAGYDDKPGTNRAKFCWAGNQMFADLDKELRFGYQKNGSLVIAFNDVQRAELQNLLQRGKINQVQNLRIVEKEELMAMEPHVHPDAIAALYAPDAGNVIPYEFAIALAENACDNGVELRTRSPVVRIQQLHNSQTESTDCNFQLTVHQWEPDDYVTAITRGGALVKTQFWFNTVALGIVMHLVAQRFLGMKSQFHDSRLHLLLVVAVYLAYKIYVRFFPATDSIPITKDTPIEEAVQRAGKPLGTPADTVHTKPVELTDMLMGGSGSADVWKGRKTMEYTVMARNVINCAGGASDIIANMIGDKSFKIKPRIGDYILLKKKQGYLARHTIFPCPDPVLGKGVLVQTTLWGNLILGPTARDMHDSTVSQMTPEQIQTFILSKCKQLVPGFDPTMTIHTFAGARAKSDRGDWIIEPSAINPHFIHVAGIDSPGLAGCPAIALYVVDLLKKDGLDLLPNPNFKKDRAPIIFPKHENLKGLKMGPVGKYDSDGTNMQQMAANVVCKCERVTELEVVRAMRRSLPIDSSQAIRKRTRAGMGSCQAKYDNYNCEARVRAIIARENNVPINQVGKRPWPATSTLPRRWLQDDDRAYLKELMAKD